MMKEEAKTWLDEQFGGDEETIAAVWSEYLGSTAEKIAETRAALEALDFPLLDRVAHTLKGNALMVGDQLLAQAAIALRDAAKKSDAAAAKAEIDRIAALDAENRA